MKVLVKATVISGKPLCVPLNNQDVRFEKWSRGNGVSMFLYDGELVCPDIEIAFSKDDLKKILEFLSE
jgi:hypothetical protein